MTESTHAALVDRAVNWLYVLWRCYYVLAEPGGGGEQPDAIGWHRVGGIVVECKVSRADFSADRRKPWRCGRGLGLFRWYLTPPGLLNPAKLPALWGLAECHPTLIRVVQRPRRVPVGWWCYWDEMILLSKAAKREQVFSGNCLCGSRRLKED